MASKYHKIALGYFLIIAIIGVTLRLFSILDIPANYKFLLHTHSHVALLGWVYTAFMILIYKLYLGSASIEKKYRKLFWGTQLTIIGMLVTFPFTGYAVFSILFSTLFLIASYVFAWLVFKYTSNEQKQTSSYLCVYYSLWYMIISSVGPWALGVIMNTLGSSSDLYKNAIYFYLHFQYNGWFILALFGILFHFLEQQHASMTKQGFRQFFRFFNIGIIATYGISLLWMNPHKSIYILAVFGALFQIVAFVILMRHLYLSWEQIKTRTSRLFTFLLRVIGFLFCVKLIVQFLGATPYFSALSSFNIDFIIGYLHWIFLGVVSVALLTFLYYHKIIKLSKKAITIYLIGFALTEGIILYKGVVIWLGQPLIEQYSEYLVFASGILMLAILNIFSVQFKRRKS